MSTTYIPTPRTDLEEATQTQRFGVFMVKANFARRLERDIAELNDRLIDRQKTLMEQATKLHVATQLLTRCRDSAGRMELGLYEDIQNFLHQ